MKSKLTFDEPEKWPRTFWAIRHWSFLRCIPTAGVVQQKLVRDNQRAVQGKIRSVICPLSQSYFNRLRMFVTCLFDLRVLSGQVRAEKTLFTIALRTDYFPR